jgi:hypothetical protein
MTTYFTTAIATSSTTNTVTVASISNMFPGLPITFSGTTFGGITQGSTYYIGTITYGYPTSRITLTSLPGGAVFALTTATGSMTANWDSGGQQILVTTPPGENLNTAFTNLTTAEILADPMKRVRLTSYIFQAGQPDWVQQEYEQAMGISLQAFSGLPGGRSAS